MLTLVCQNIPRLFWDTTKPGLWTLDWTMDWTRDDHYQLVVEKWSMCSLTGKVNRADSITRQ